MGMRNAECGMRNAELRGFLLSAFRFPLSAFRIPSVFRILPQSCTMGPMIRGAVVGMAAERRQSRVAWGALARWGYIFALSALMFSGVALSRFSRDESQWIYTARYLTLFRNMDIYSPEWDSYWTRTQPPLARYVMGLSLKAGGFDLLKLNGPWDFTREDSENESLGNMPTSEMLFWARLPISLFAAGSVVLVYLLGSQLTGTAGGLVAATWLALNPRSRELMTRAESEGLVICLLLLILWLTLRLVGEMERAQRRGARWARPLVLTVTLGVLCGLAASAKLSGLVALLAVWLVLAVDVAVRWLSESHLRVPARRNVLFRRLLAALATMAGTGSLALLTFVLLNPAIYARPFSGPSELLAYRQAEMQEQMALYPSAALNTPLERFVAAARRPLFTYGTINGVIKASTDEDNPVGEWLPLDAFLVVLGLGITIGTVVGKIRKARQYTAHRLWRFVSPLDSHAPGGIGVAGITLLYSFSFYAAISVSMGLDWDRYVLPLVVFSALWAGVGIAWLVKRFTTWRAGTPQPA